MSVVFYLVYLVLSSAQCTSNSGIELLVDGMLWTSSTDAPLYKPVGSTGTLVRCQRCTGEGQPSWFNSTGDKIPFCDDAMSHMICVDRVKAGVRDLKVLKFMQSQERNYTCKLKNDMESITIEVLYLFLTSKLITVDMNVTLTCETTGSKSITYQWETSNINGGQWMNISDGNNKTLVVRNLEQSQQYRCIVSNEAGSTRSDVATVTVLSKYSLYE